MEQIKKPQQLKRLVQLADICREQLMQISPEEKKRTIVHCPYFAKPYYQNGGWCMINKTTYLINANTGAKIQIDSAYNIPFAPDYHLMGSTHAVLNFILFFSAIPASWTTFHLIEECRDRPFVEKNIERNNKGVYNITL